ncbi:Protein transport protein sec73 [Wickerhamiella sorbophila]|uniref:Protein transport protein sec73 n=1 Tax=Wickerhamiella sorbophila TaxID=45607 RepID=A0A2T0FEI4_9ASCO|nr:Protein transport protein sec73 [Wickerhamiella sorbophila]PRT53413.1 Protein transport protein sec73 [Wickerhamiella sorbophila]
MQSLKKKIQKVSVPKDEEHQDISSDTATEAARRKLSAMFFRNDKKKKEKRPQYYHEENKQYNSPQMDYTAENDSSSISMSRDSSIKSRQNSKMKTSSLTKLRQRTLRRTSVDENHTGLSHTGTPSIGTLASAALRPFPLIRSQSSLSGGPASARLSEEHRPRRKTESEAFFSDSDQDRRFTVSSDGRRTKSITHSRTPSIYMMPEDNADMPLPPRNGESVTGYLDLLQELGFGPTVCSSLSQESDKFLEVCLLAYMDRFSFHGEPIDMSLRKFLMFQRLPRESQQIERVLQAFSTAYHEQNPNLFQNSDQVYFIVFSMVILHTDTFNKNVKHKMSKSSYMRTGYCDGVPLEVLDYIYDNITYTQFIHTEDDSVLAQLFDVPSTPSDLQLVSSSTASVASAQSATPRRTSFGWSKDMFDPYMLILEGRLARLRPTSLVRVLSANDPYICGYLTSVTEVLGLRNRLANGPIIQLVSERSRPDVYTGVNHNTVSEINTEDLLLLASPGVVDIKVVKMGILERRESSKKMLYSPRSIWREWGAILTESQLYLFKNVAWVKSLMAESSASPDPAAAVTRTSLEGFNATTVLSTKDMAALLYESSSNEDEKSMFLLRGSGGMHTWLSASDESERMDWVRCINFAAAYTTHPIPLSPPSYTSTDSCVYSRSQNSSGAGAGTGFYRSASDTSLTSTAALHAQRTRSRALLHQISELDQKLLTLQNEIVAHERDCRHLMILAPIQQKTRDALVFAAGQYASKCDWQWIDRARYQSYRNILEMDLRFTESRWKDLTGSGSKISDVMTALTEESASLSAISIGSDRGPIERNDSRVQQASLEEVLTENSSQEFDTASLVRDKEAFEVRGHRFSLVDVNPDILGKSRSSPTDQAASAVSASE